MTTIKVEMAHTGNKGCHTETLVDSENPKTEVESRGNKGSHPEKAGCLKALERCEELEAADAEWREQSPGREDSKFRVTCLEVERRAGDLELSQRTIRSRVRIRLVGHTDRQEGADLHGQAEQEAIGFI